MRNKTMCGRYIATELGWAEYAKLLGLEILPAFRDSFNIAPSQSVPAIRAEDNHSRAVLLRWGLVPAWAKGEIPKYSTSNATIEKIDSAPTWRTPWKRSQRCILPADGFYEWHVNTDGSKQPFFIRCIDQPTFGMAGLWDRSVNAQGDVIESCTIITMPANKLMAEVHNTKSRMPAILDRESLKTWLCESADAAKSVLQPYPDDRMAAYPVSTRVNSPRNNSASLIEPVK